MGGDIKTVIALPKLITEQEHVTHIYPDDTNQTVTFVSNAVAHTWSDWVEIVDAPGATTLSSKFATREGHLTALIVESTTKDDAIHIIEIAYGTPKIIVSRHRFISSTNKISAVQFTRVRADHIHAGEVVYYRMKCSIAAPAAEATICLRYHYHS